MADPTLSNIFLISTGISGKIVHYTSLWVFRARTPYIHLVWENLDPPLICTDITLLKLNLNVTEW